MDLPGKGKQKTFVGGLVVGGKENRSEPGTGRDMGSKHEKRQLKLEGLCVYVGCRSSTVETPKILGG